MMSVLAMMSELKGHEFVCVVSVVCRCLAAIFYVSAVCSIFERDGRDAQFVACWWLQDGPTDCLDIVPPF